MRTKRNFAVGVVLLTVVCLLAFMLTACGGDEGPAPEVKALTLTASAGATLGVTDSEHVLGYIATEGSTVTVSVKKGDADAAASDYTYTADTRVIVFHAEGNYTITVRAEQNGKSDEATVSATVTDATQVCVKNVAIAAKQDAVRGRVGQTHVLTSTVTPATATETVKVEKQNGTTWEEVSGVYTAQGRELVFAQAGKYRVTVSASSGSESASDYAEIDIVAFSAIVTGELSADRTVYGKAEIEHTLSYAVIAEEAYPATPASVVRFFKSADGVQYAEASAETDYVYTESNGKVTFKTVGKYKIEIACTSADIVAATKEIKLEVTGVENPDITLDAGEGDDKTYVRAAEGSAVGIFAAVTYDATDDKATEAYEVLYHNGYGYETATQGETYRWNADKTEFTPLVAGLYRIKLIAEGTRGTRSEKIVAVEATPVFGADPFGGTHDTLLPSTGLMLYYDAVSEGRQLTPAQIEYEVVAVDLSKSDGTKLTKADVVIDSILDNRSDRFVLVQNFGNNTASGTVDIKISASVRGATAEYTKTFTVKTLEGSALAESVKGFNAYVADVMGDGINDGANYDDILYFGHRQNAVVTKEGVIFHRSNGAWGYAKNDMFYVEPKLADNFQVDFTYTILGRHDVPNGNKNKASFCVNLRTGAQSGWYGNQMSFYAEDRSEIIKAGYWGTNNNGISGAMANATHPFAAIGKAYHIRFTHTLSGGKAYFAWQWSEDGNTYVDWLKFDVNASTVTGNPGTPVYSMQFIYEAGCIAFGNVKLTVL